MEGHGGQVTNPTPRYLYRASLIRVIDADTYVLDIDLGFGVHQHATVRLQGVNCPELDQPGGRLAFEAAARLIPRGAPLIVETIKTRAGGDVRTFARWVADVWNGQGSVAEQLIEGGFGVRA